MTYRSIEKADIPTVADIQARAFRGNAEEIVERYQAGGSDGGRDDWRDLRLLENERSQAVAAAKVFERTVSLNGGELNAGLVGGLGVPPEQRRRGYARQMVIGLLEELYQKETPVSLLFPFSIEYYQGLGYGLANLNWFLDISPHKIPEYPERMSVRRVTPQDHAAIRDCYEKARQEPRNNGWLARTDWEWQNRVWTSKREAVVCPATGALEGYLLYDFKWDEEERPFRIIEWVAVSDAAWRGLTGFLAALAEQATVIRYNAARNDPLLLALKEPYSTVGGVAEFVNYEAARLVTGFMLRVVHLRAALRARRYPLDLEAELVIRVEDPIIPANNQSLYVNIVGGSASVAPARGLFPDNQPTDVKVDIATFSQLFAGFVSAEQARALGRLRADDANCELLTRLFAAAPLYMQRLDYF
jgi:predicted acetyltransferase